MEISVQHLLTVDQAIGILDGVPLMPRVVRVPLLDAVGLRLAEAIVADRDYPPFDKALMDGYAVVAADAATAGARLRVVETVAAGEVAVHRLSSGEAVKIMTGAPLPVGADAVVPVEQTSREGEHVRLNVPIKMGAAVARIGSDAPAGQKLLPIGVRLGPAQIGVAASVGKTVVAVFDRPSVALLSTGDEIVEADQTPTGAQIRNSNGPMMTALLQQLGCRVIPLGIVRDRPDDIRDALRRGLEADAVFITGGMSMGERDYVPGLLKELGMELKISKLRIKPGKPFAFGVKPREGRSPAMAFGLPGNPVSALVCTVRLASRVIHRLAGGTPPELTQAELLAELPAPGPRETYIPAILTDAGIRPLRANSSADIFTLATGNALILRPADAVTAAVGAYVFAISLA